MFRVTDVDSDVADWFGLEVRPDGRSNVHEYDRLLGVGTGLLYSIGLSTFISIRRHLRTAAKVVKLLKQLGGLS